MTPILHLTCHLNFRIIGMEDGRVTTKTYRNRPIAITTGICMKHVGRVPRLGVILEILNASTGSTNTCIHHLWSRALKR